MTDLRHGSNLECDTCHAVWPTERAADHGGSRQFGEPCAYRRSDGRYCAGHVTYGGAPYSGVYAPRRSWDGPWSRPGSGGGGRPIPRAESWWRAILSVPPACHDLATVRRHYRERVKTWHPDAGGSHADMVTLNEAYRLALVELGQR